MKNFFIVGVDQKTLISIPSTPSHFSIGQIGEQKKEILKPEVLFSMYQKKDFVQNYLQVSSLTPLSLPFFFQYIFPEKMMVEFKPQDPKFFTFMSTDSEGFNSFFHCLIFYDEVNEAEVSYDTDNIDALRKHMLNQSPTKKKTTTTRKTNDGYASDDEDGQQQVFSMVKKNLKQRMLRRKETTGFLDAYDLARVKNEREKQQSASKGEGEETPKAPKGKDQMFINAKLKSGLKEQEFMKFAQNTIGSTLMPSGQHPQSSKDISLNKSKQAGLQKSYIGPFGQNKLEKILEDKNKVNGRHQKQNSQSNNEDSAVLGRDRLKTSDEKFNSPLAMIKSTNPLASTNTNGKPAIEQNQTKDFSDESSISFTKQAKMASNHRQGETATSNNHFGINVKPCDDDYFGMLKKKPLNQSYLYSEEREQSCAGFGGMVNDDLNVRRQSQIEMDLSSDLHNTSHDAKFQYLSPEQLHLMEQQYHFNVDNHTFNALMSKKKYIPVAFCMETETEFHDVFREILLALYEMIRVPETLLTGNIATHANRLISFAELITHLAFLRTIPAPPFNSTFNIHFLNQTIQVKENAFDQIPNKNLQPIKVLLEVLDVRSIFFCWKALLFDKSLVLVSSQYSLQFYIAEALKQLIFPLAWQGSYIQPGNESLLDLCDGTITMIYAQSSVFSSYDYFEGLQSTEMAICDIDASLTNELQLQALLKAKDDQMKDGKDRQLPCIHQEQMYLKLLNLLKNQKVSQYDLAFQQTPKENEDFVQNVRDTFFQMLKPYLVNIHSCIKKVDDPSTANFYKYFDSKKYKAYFEDNPTQLKFAENLLQSSQFIHLCDDYFSDEMTNFNQMTCILKSRGELSSDELSDKFKELEVRFESSPQGQGSPTLQDENGVEVVNGGCNEAPLVINIRMPQDNQRVMLFDKILNLIESGVKTNKKSMANDSPMSKSDPNNYIGMISDIKKFYPIKLKGSYKKYQHLDQKMNQASYLRKINESARPQDKLGKSTNNPYNNPLINGKRVPTSRESCDSVSVFNQKGNKMKIDQEYVEDYMEQIRISINDNNARTIQTRMNGLPPALLLPYMRGGGNQKLDQLGLTKDEITITQSYIQMSSSTVTIPEDDQSRKIVKLIYWQHGLLNFINQIFGLIKEKNFREINYYFILKEQIKKLSGTNKCKSNLKGGQLNNITEEESKDEGISQIGTPNNRAQKNMKFQQTTPQSKRSSNQLPNMKGKVNHNNLKKSSLTSFTDQKEWFKIEGWESKQLEIKASYQFILLRLKVYERFECVSFASDHIFFDLMNYPSYYWRFFPQAKLSTVWESLTQDVQEQIIGEYGWKRSNTIWGYFILKYYTQNKQKKNRLIGGSSASLVSTQSNANMSRQLNSESIFFKANIDRSTDNGDLSKDEAKHPSQTFQKGSSSKNSMASSPDIVDKKKSLFIQKQESKQMDLTRECIKNKVKQRQSTATSDQCIQQETVSSLPQTHGAMRKYQSDENFTFTHNTLGGMKATSSQTLVQPKTDKYACDNVFEKALGVDSNAIESPYFKDKKSIFYNSELQGGSISLNYHLGGKLKKKTQKLEPMGDPDGLSYKLLARMIKFWSTNNKFIEKKLGGFEKAEVPRIKKELLEFEDLLQFFRKRRPDFKEDDTIKQVFLLNTFNYLVLYKMAVLMVCSPEAIKLLKTYTMWQQFLISASMVIAGIKIDCYLIMMYFLRNRTEPYEFSKFMIKIQDIQADYIQYFKVNHPHKLIIFGFFLGLKGFTYLKKFKKETLDEQLRQSAEDFIARKLVIKSESKLIVTHKNIQWLISDFNDNSLEGILDYFAHTVMTSKNKKFVKVADKIIEKLQTKEENEKSYVVYYKLFDWKIRAHRFIKPFAGAE